MHNIDWTLLKGSLTGRNSAQQEAGVARWLAESPANRAFYERLCNFMANGGREEVDVDRNFREFVRRTRAQARNRIIKVSAVAAACIAALGVFLFSDFRPQPGYSAIVPGSYKAVLYTGEGDPVVLEDGAQKELLATESFSLNQQVNQITYDPGVRPEEQPAVRHRLVTPHSGEYRLRLGDGTLVYVNSESQLEYPPVFHAGERRVSLSGEAYFEVARSGDPFIIEIAGMEIRVLGTQFNVRAYEGEAAFHTTLVDGSVEVTADARTVVLSPGEQAILRQGEELTKRQVDVSKYAAWKDGFVAFDDERLEDIMLQLGRWYNMDVEFQSPALRDIRFTGNLDRYGDIRILLEKIEKLDIVDFDIRGTHISVRRK